MLFICGLQNDQKLKAPQKQTVKPMLYSYSTGLTCFVEWALGRACKPELVDFRASLFLRAYWDWQDNH